MQVVPRQGYSPIDLQEVMEELRLRDVSAPLLLRFPDILDDRIQKITNCFKKAAQEYSYAGQNFVVYPIKVNQMSQVVEEIVSHGNKYNIGLEAGSKPDKTAPRPQKRYKKENPAQTRFLPGAETGLFSNFFFQL